ncbi:MAG TPA: alpha-L-arabinofuranosidase C-terminal domain-containing protein [Lacipirellulaceae bacterium]
MTKLFISTIAIFLAAAQVHAENLLPPVDNASADAESNAAWRTNVWNGEAEFTVVEGGRDGEGKCLMVESQGGGDASWFHRIAVEPNSVYRLAGWIKTEDVAPTTGRGVVLNVHGIGGGTPPLTGTNDWTRVELLVRPGDAREIQVNGTFGAWGLATGRAWFDDITLERIDLTDFQPAVAIDAAKEGPAINPFIYGQFIEHLGRCIYGGIWAEMLEDRKFYFPITKEYNPYRSLTRSEFPVVGASPWEIVGDDGGVTMVTEGPFVGEHTPRLQPGSGIRQNDLGLVEGKEYVGYVWLRAPEGVASVTVGLAWGDDPADRQSITVATEGNDYAQFPIQFTAGRDTDEGRLTIDVAEAPCLVGAVSLMPADNVRGFRADTLALLKQLNATMYRWPGGNFVSGYNWRDGIGPRDRRPPRKNPAWTGVEHNDVGIDEFIDFCHDVGAEPMVAVNTGFGDNYSAAQEVEYTNGSADTVGGSWRAQNGNAEPYGVKYWCVGNEMWGNWQLGYMSLEHYTQKHNLVAKAMLKVDPQLVLVGSGDLGTRASLGGGRDRRDVNWTQGMLKQCADSMDLISEHFYSGQRMDDIPSHVAQIVDPIRSKAVGHRRMQSQIASLRGRTIPIAMDEWNYWFRPYEYGELGCVYQLRDALGIAAGLHEYFRNSDIIHMAHYAQTVNVIGCIKTTKTAAFFESTALPLLLYRREFGTTPLTVTGNHDVLALDVAAAKTEDGRAITIGIVNPQAEPQTVELQIDGVDLAETATVWRIAGDDPESHNTAAEQPIAIAEERDVEFDGEVTVPPYSVNLYRVAIE